ncbi:MAG: DUF285 domain-containing protein [Lachnospiraceae bacterium]|nr:DUF285 domain-containing protein [Lachnospiraceae bacterium]
MDSGNQGLQLCHKYILHHLLPQIAWEMGRKKRTLLSFDETRQIAAENFRRLKDEDFARLFPEYLGKSRLMLTQKTNEAEWFDFAVAEQLVGKLGLLVRHADGGYSLIHDNFRGYLSEQYSREGAAYDRRKKQKKAVKISASVLLIVLIFCGAGLPMLGDAADSLLNVVNSWFADDVLDLSWENNILKADVCSEGSEQACEYSVFKMDLTRTEVTSITFLDTLSDAPEDAEDLSEAQDGSVLGWTVRNSKSGSCDLYIAGEGGVAAPANCLGMFNGYDNVTNIEFNGAFHTENAETMSYMFKRCNSLTYLDLSSFDTSGVESMQGMFHLCSSLTEADVSNFDTSCVTCMKDMFSECESLSCFDLARLTVILQRIV